MPQNFNPRIANGGACVPTIIGNYSTYPWGMPPHLSPQVVDVNNHMEPQDQPRQNSVLVPVESPDETEQEYRGPLIHVHIPLVTQPAIQYPYQGVQFVYPRMPTVYHGASTANVVPQMFANVAL